MKQNIKKDNNRFPNSGFALPLILLAAIILSVLSISAALMIISGKSEIPHMPSINEPSAENKPIYTAQVTEVNGKAWKTQQGTATEIRKGDEIGKDTLIRTLADSRVVVALKENSKIYINNNSLVAIKEIDQSNVLINQQKGKLTANIEDQYNQFKIRSHEVEITSRGTVFGVEIDSEVIVTVFKDQVNVAAGVSEFSVYENQEWRESRPIVVDVDGRKLVNSDNFYKWSVGEAEVPIPTQEPDKADDGQDIADNQLPENAIGGPGDGTASVALSGTKSGSNTVTLSWNASGNLNEGFIVNYGKGESNFSVYLSDPGSRAFDVGALETGTYYFNICVVRSGGCAATSNTITVGI